MSVSCHTLVGDISRVIRGWPLAIATGFTLVAGAPPAFANYIGDSFLDVPGQPGNWAGKDHPGWMRAVAMNWDDRLQGAKSCPGDILAGDKLCFGGPIAPKPGNHGKLTLAFHRNNPDLQKLLKLCNSKEVVPVARYAEESDRARPVLENGPRPANIPAFWEYRLHDVQVIDCPVVDGAEDQAVTIAFSSVEWLNWDPLHPMNNPIVVPPSTIYAVQPVEPTPGKAVEAFVITWIGPVTDPGDAACPTMNHKPTDEDIYRYMTPEEAAKLKAKVGAKGLTAGSDTEDRGPHRLSVSAFPGIIPDPGQIEPQTKIADGLDLDGNDGTGTPPKGIRRHGNFTSPDGRKGIDNQLMRIWGCVIGERGKRGYNNQTGNARRADGNIVTLIEVSNIANAQNDDDVEIAIIHSQDKAMRDNSGHIFIPNYSFRPTYDPNFAYYNIRVHGRISNGVVTSDIIPVFHFNPGQGPANDVFQARIRLTPNPDGSMRGLIGGYVDYRNKGFGGYGEGLFGFQTPAVYHSMERNADGLYDPVSKEYHGLSMAMEMDTVPAFITPIDPKNIPPQFRVSSGKGKEWVSP